MNSLTLIIYGISVLGGLSTFLAWCAGLGTLGLVFVTIWFLVIGFNSKDTEVQASVPFFKSIRNIVIPLFLIGWTSVIFIPDRRTMILMASSEIGERVLNTSGVKEITSKSYELLNKWVSKELDSITSETMPKEKSK